MENKKGGPGSEEERISDTAEKLKEVLSPEMDAKTEIFAQTTLAAMGQAMAAEMGGDITNVTEEQLDDLFYKINKSAHKARVRHLKLYQEKSGYVAENMEEQMSDNNNANNNNKNDDTQKVPFYKKNWVWGVGGLVGGGAAGAAGGYFVGGKRAVAKLAVSFTDKASGEATKSLTGSGAGLNIKM